MRKIILFVAGVATGVVISIGTWIGVGAIAPTTALAGSTAVDPLAMMTGMKDLPTSHYDDYSVVFVGPEARTQKAPSDAWGSVFRSVH
jgi:hypothetical protein